MTLSALATAFLFRRTVVRNDSRRIDNPRTVPWGGGAMTFYEVLAQVIELLQREGRVSYRALKLQFSLDDDYLEGLKEELIEAKRVAIDEGGKVLAWVGPPATVAPRGQEVVTATEQ